MTLTVDRIGAYAVDEIDIRAASDAEVRPLAEMGVAWSAEVAPEDPPVPVEVAIGRMRGQPKEVVRRDWIVRTPDGEEIGRALLARFDAPDNQHIRETFIYVRPAHRRRGIARGLFARMVRAASSERDDIVFFMNTSSRSPAGAAFTERLQAQRGLENRTSQLDLTALDGAMVREWASIDPKGYRLEWVEGDVPDQLIQNVIVAYDTMNTAPRERLQMEDWKTTPELIRSFDEGRKRAGRVRRLLLAIDEATAETAGFTEVEYDARQPHLVAQDGTAVVPAHRGHGIGKWVKARMIERILHEWPNARLIRTGNAYSNAPMLSINDRLGFKVAWSVTVWQLPLADAKRYLAETRSA